MKKTLFGLVASVAASGLASAAPHFHSDFTEATLGDIIGLNVDAPAPGAGNGNDGSGTVVLNSANQTLDITAMDANMWTTRDGAPIAWVSSPLVAVGDTWFVETQLTHTDSTEANPTWDQAGITFYSGTPGNNPGSENTGTDQSLFAGINDWNAWTHAIQGFADNDPSSTTTGVPAGGGGGIATFEYRVEITEGGASDTYNFFYREAPIDPWTQYGPVDLSQDFDNSAVGIWVKSHNNNTGVTTSFNYLTVDVISGVSGVDSDSDGIDDGWEIAVTAAPGNLTDLNGLASGPGPGAGTGDFDGDGLSDFEEYEFAILDGTFPGLNPTLADTDSDNRNDGDEVDGITGPPAVPPTSPIIADSDGDGLLDGDEDNTGTYIDATETGSNPTIADTDGDGLNDGFEVTNNAAGYDPNVDDSASDFDGDALTLAQEIAAGTDPALPDTDADGLYDGAETGTGIFVSYDPVTNTGDTGTDPLNSDSDSDTLLDGVETGSGNFVGATDTGSNPNMADTDGDSFDDGLEVTLTGGDPNDAAVQPDVIVGYQALGGDWLSAHGAFDIDGDSALGTDGYILFGDFAGVQINNQPYTFLTESTPLPSYVVAHDMGADFTSIATAFPTYGMIDNPLTLDGTDQFAGVAVGTGGAAGSVLEMMTFEVGSLLGGQVVRVGVLGGTEGTADGRWDASEITLSGPNGYSATAINLEANPGGVNAGWIFFDITDNGTYTVSATRRAGNGGAGFGGLTFDSTGGIGIAIQSISYDMVNEMITLTWDSSVGATYGVFYGTDLIDFGADVDDSVVSGGTSTTLTFPHPSVGAPELFFRVEQN